MSVSSIRPRRLITSSSLHIVRKSGPVEICFIRFRSAAARVGLVRAPHFPAVLCNEYLPTSVLLFLAYSKHSFETKQPSRRRMSRKNKYQKSQQSNTLQEPEEPPAQIIKRAGPPPFFPSPKEIVLPEDTG